MSFNVEKFIARYKERAEAVKNRSIPPVGGDDRMAFIKQAETDFQDFMIIADSEFVIEEDYLGFKYKLDSQPRFLLIGKISAITSAQATAISICSFCVPLSDLKSMQ